MVGGPRGHERIRFGCAAGVTLLLAALGGQAFAAGQRSIFPFQVRETRLDNGLNVVAIPYDSPGVVAFLTIVRTGSRDEVEPGRSGFAHFFEHMMFRGTERYSTDEYNDVLKRLGADSNAFTTDDYTAYHIVGPAGALRTIMDLEADRFQNLKYTEDEFRTEALAVLGEYNMNASNPLFPMHERLRELAFRRHTYGHTTMGYLQDIKTMPEQFDFSLQFFDRYYRPENTIVLVVGDLEPAQVFRMAQEHYGGWERGYRPPEIPKEPPQEARRAAHVEWPNPTRPYLMLGYRTPAFSTATADSAVLDIISQLLFAESAPLHQEIVVERQWADQLSGGVADRRDPYLFTILARVRSDDLLPEVKRVIDEHIGRVQREPIDPERLGRVKAHLRYRFALGLDSPAAVAFQVAHYLNLTGEVETMNRLFEQYERVTTEDIRRVAREVFQPARETMVTLAHGPEPESAEEVAP